MTPVPPLDHAGIPKNRLECYEGDPACDSDPDLTNKQCTFNVQLCINNHDPNIACAPTDIATVELLSPDRNGLRNTPEDTSNADALLTSIAGTASNGQVQGFCRNNNQMSCATNAECNSPGKTNGRCSVFVRFSPAATASDRCGMSADIVVPLRALHGGGFATFSKRFRLRATNSARGADVNYLTLRCLPSS